VVTRVWWGEGKGKLLVKGYNISVRRNKFWRCVVQHGDYSSYFVYLKSGQT
jgi:hypothetical protein